MRIFYTKGRRTITGIKKSFCSRFFQGTMRKEKICLICVAGARPNFMKIIPLMAAFREEPSIEVILMHNGQHDDEKMSDLFFRQLEIPDPDINLGGGGSHAQQTAAIMERALKTVTLKITVSI